MGFTHTECPSSDTSMLPRHVPAQNPFFSTNNIETQASTRTYQVMISQLSTQNLETHNKFTSLQVFQGTSPRPDSTPLRPGSTPRPESVLRPGSTPRLPSSLGGKRKGNQSPSEIPFAKVLCEDDETDTSSFSGSVGSLQMEDNGIGSFKDFEACLDQRDLGREHIRSESAPPMIAEARDQELFALVPRMCSLNFTQWRDREGSTTSLASSIFSHHSFQSHTSNPMTAHFSSSFDSLSNLCSQLTDTRLV